MTGLRRLALLLGGLAAWAEVLEVDLDGEAVSIDLDSEGLLLATGRLWTQEELDADPKLMLVILGEVFDVTGGEEYYDDGGGYEVFRKQDATRAFVSGNFTQEAASDDVSDFTPSQCLGVLHWMNFYRNHDTYKQLGRLAGGRYYNAEGGATEHLTTFISCCAEGLAYRKVEAELDETRPKCSSKWTAADGGKVWCRDGSVPRIVKSGLKGEVCRCFDFEKVKDDTLRLDVERYKDCPATASECQTTPPKKKKKKKKKN